MAKKKGDYRIPFNPKNGISCMHYPEDNVVWEYEENRLPLQDFSSVLLNV